MLGPFLKILSTVYRGKKGSKNRYKYPGNDAKTIATVTWQGA